MKAIKLLSISLLICSCAERTSNFDSNSRHVANREIVVSRIQSILDSAKVNGSVLIYELEKDQFYSNDFKWAKRGKLPASTFKIANSIIALETGIAANDSSLFKWNGEKRRFKSWEQDLMLRDAFHWSCVPCYQQIARNIGVDQMNEYLSKLDYGNMHVDSTNIDLFWLEGKSRISQYQQIDFLTRFYKSELPISGSTEAIMKRMMVMEQMGTYVLRGKSGWSITKNKNNGWFVGYIEDGFKTYFFATNIEPGLEFDMAMFPTIRKDVTLKALKVVL